jgi:hypothetical protein
MAESRDGEFAPEGKCNSFGISDDKRMPRVVRPDAELGSATA